MREGQGPRGKEDQSGPTVFQWSYRSETQMRLPIGLLSTISRAMRKLKTIFRVNYYSVATHAAHGMGKHDQNRARLTLLRLWNGKTRRLTKMFNIKQFYSSFQWHSTGRATPESCKGYRNLSRKKRSTPLCFKCPRSGWKGLFLAVLVPQAG